MDSDLVVKSESPKVVRKVEWSVARMEKKLVGRMVEKMAVNLGY